MILCDNTIRYRVARGEIGVEPWDPAMLQPASLDVRLHNQFIREGSEGTYPETNYVDFRKERPLSYSWGEELFVTEEQGFYLAPMEFVLARTVEILHVPPDLQVTVCGKSSLGRLGLFVENAGFVDPGFQGTLTLELFNASKRTLILRPGMRIAQLSFAMMDARPGRSYGDTGLGSHYQGQVAPTSSRFSV